MKDEGLEAYRDAAVELLSAGYTEDILDVDEFERRLEVVQAATSREEIREAVSGLPEAVRQPLPGQPLPEESESASDQQVISILSERKLSGDWLHQGRATSISFLGSSRLDLRDTALDRREIYLNVLTIMGETKIVVPPDMRVENDITPLLAEVHIKAPRARDPKRRTLRLTGFALMGEIQVEVRA